MAITYLEGKVRGPSGKEKSVNFLVDSGATYSLLPKKIWEAIELEPKREVTFTLADGTAIERSVSEAYIALDQGEAHTPVILGEKGDEALLGVVTLEILGLVFNPFDRTLRPMRMLLCSRTSGDNARNDRMTDTKAKLSALIDGFECQSDFTSVYLDRKTGEILTVSEDDRAALECEDESMVPEWQKDHLEMIRPILEGPEEPGRYLGLPDRFDFDEYRRMEHFIAGLPDENVQQRLATAIQGKGAFRRFKDGIHEHGAAEEWYRYRNQAVKQFVVEWCENKGIRFIDDTANNDSSTPT